MNILITGSNGFIGRNLRNDLSKIYNHNVVTMSRKEADLLDSQQVKEFFERNNQAFDLVLHTAVEGGRRTKNDDVNIVYNNLLMLYNLLSCQNYFQCIISFGSGAELDRRYDINPNALNRYPVDPYGLSKSVIDKISADEPKLCNFRIYNCFGVDEQPDRMIKSNMIKYLNNEDMTIHQDRRMDFFFIHDLSQLINFFIQTQNIPKVFDCCYKDKIYLTDIANIINNLAEHKVKIIYDKPDTMDKDYIGQYVETHIPYIGLKNGIKMMYNKLKERANG